MTSNLSSVHAQIAALTRWARTPDRSAATSPAREAMLAKFEHRHECALCGVVEIPEELRGEARARAVAAAMSAHYKRLALRSATARGQARALHRTARATERELHDDLAAAGDDRAAS